MVAREGGAVGESVGRAAAGDSSSSCSPGGCGVVAEGVEALAGGSRGAALG